MGRRDSRVGRWAQMAFGAFCLTAHACSLAGGDRSLDSWNAESVGKGIDACQQGVPSTVPREQAARFCGCVMAEMQLRWTSPHVYAKDVKRHNQELADTGALARCNALTGSGVDRAAAPKTP
jgi:hypothetical protein